MKSAFLSEYNNSTMSGPVSVITILEDPTKFVDTTQFWLSKTKITDILPEDLLSFLRVVKENEHTLSWK